MVARLQKKSLAFLPEFERFINDSRRGKRLQPNGKKIGTGTVANYEFTLGLIKKFCDTKKIDLRIRPSKWLTSRETETEKNYWKKFYRSFTNYLYDDCGYFDNYVGQTIKNTRIFFNYLNKERALGIGDFHKLFYVTKDEIAIFPLSPEELNFLIYDKDFEESLSPRMKEVKDFFVFGCTVALRFSDLKALRKTSIRIINGSCYLIVRSIKTATDTSIKLPAYAVEIINRYSHLKKQLLPSFNVVNLNKYIKILLRQAGFEQPVSIVRNRRGTPIEIKTHRKANFCDVASTHTMRRTAITTMLSLGVSEQIVRSISGHAPNSKEFYRYVSWSQTYKDQETERMFEKLQQKVLSTPKSILPK